MQARSTDMRDTLAALIDERWSLAFPDRAEADIVVARSTTDLSLNPDHVAEYIWGRTVLVFEQPYSSSLLTRHEDMDDYELKVWIAERYEEGGVPFEAWVSERKYFVQWLYRLVRDPRKVRLDGSAWPQEWSEVLTCDTDKLAEHGFFWSNFTVTFREERLVEGVPSPSDNLLVWGKTALTWTA